MSGFGVLGEQEAESLHAKFNAIPDKAKRLLSIDKGHLISQLRHTTLQPSHSRVKEKKKKNTVHPETCVYPALYLYSSPPVSKKLAPTEIVSTTCRLQFSAFNSVSKIALGGERAP